MKSFDFIIIGGGIIGLTMARALRKIRAGSVLVLEKENALGLHATGRNSGVIHAGIYYSTDSLNAKFCVRGARLMREYADERKVPIKSIGKVITTRHGEDLKQLDVLYERARANQVEVKMI